MPPESFKSTNSQAIKVTPKRDLPAAAVRALREAEERRAATDRPAKHKTPEKGGPKGEEPTRYGDWERSGRAVDF